MGKAKRISKEGLKAIFGDNLNNALNDIETFKEHTEINNKIKVSEIRPNPFQPRTIFKDEELQELANSIKEHGLISPITVNKDINGYVLVAGERRLRAHKLLGLKEIEANVVEYNELQMEEVALIENIQREQLNVIEEAKAFNSLIKKHNLTQEALSQKVAKSRTYVTNSIRLLKLPITVQKSLMENKLTTGHVKVLLGLEDETLIIEVANKIIINNFSVRETEALIRKIKNQKGAKKVAIKSKEFLYAEQLLREKLSTKVVIKNKNINIKFTSTSDLNRILKIMDALEK